MTRASLSLTRRPSATRSRTAATMTASRTSESRSRLDVFLLCAAPQSSVLAAVSPRLSTSWRPGFSPPTDQQGREALYLSGLMPIR